MPYEFKLPDLGEGVAEGEVVHWFVKEGEAVAEDAPLVSVLTDKANVEIPSPKAGTIVRIHAKEGEKVKVGALLVSIETGAPTGESPPAPTEVEVPARAAPPGPAEAAPVQPPPPAPSGRVLASPHVRRLANERGIDLASVVGSGPGGRILEGDLEKISSAPAVAPVPAENVPSPRSPGPAPTAAQPPARAAAPGESLPPVGGSPEVERIPIRGLRRVIAEHMAESTHRAAHFTYVEEVDASELVRVRERMAPHLEGSGVKLSFLPLILKAAVAGLRKYPRMNAWVDDDRQEIVVHHRYHLGIATATPDGLLVPVLRDVDRKSVAELARELAGVAERARSGKLSRAELSGSTFTITSLGALGGLLATPILNYPEVAIMGVHRIATRPVVRPDGSIGPAQIMNLSVSLDHRVLDGITGAEFLAEVKRHLEDPHLLFAYLA
jgi:pyruvate dehydrogenase E2 component (dihydrolipoamide acetyltransferase)